MRCFDDPVNLRGNSETSEFEQVVIQFEYCDVTIPELNCLTRDEAVAQMGGKSVVILSNERAIEEVNKQELSLISLDKVESEEPEEPVKPDYVISETSRLHWSLFNPRT